MPWISASGINFLKCVHGSHVGVLLSAKFANWQWSNPEKYGRATCCMNAMDPIRAHDAATTEQITNKAVCIFHRIYCTQNIMPLTHGFPGSLFSVSMIQSPTLQIQYDHGENQLGRNIQRSDNTWPLGDNRFFMTREIEVLLPRNVKSVENWYENVNSLAWSSIFLFSHASEIYAYTLFFPMFPIKLTFLTWFRHCIVRDANPILYAYIVLEVDFF